MNIRRANRRPGPRWLLLLDELPEQPLSEDLGCGIDEGGHCMRLCLLVRCWVPVVVCKCSSYVREGLEVDHGGEGGGEDDTLDLWLEFCGFDEVSGPHDGGQKEILLVVLNDEVRVRYAVSSVVTQNRTNKGFVMGNEIRKNRPSCWSGTAKRCARSCPLP